MLEPQTLVNAFEVPHDKAPEFIAAWETTRVYLSSRPGYIDTSHYTGAVNLEISRPGRGAPSRTAKFIFGTPFGCRVGR